MSPMPPVSAALSRLDTTLLVTCAAGTGAMGGVFFAFSAFVMPALARLPAPQAVAAMQSINITAVRPAFMTGLFGTALACLVVGVRATPAAVHGDRRATLSLIGGALYLVVTIGITIAYAVPLNDKLAAVDPSTPAAATMWADYVRDWTNANTVRAAAGIGAAVAYALALLRAHR